MVLLGAIVWLCIALRAKSMSSCSLALSDPMPSTIAGINNSHMKVTNPATVYPTARPTVEVCTLEATSLADMHGISKLDKEK